MAEENIINKDNLSNNFNTIQNSNSNNSLVDTNSNVSNVSEKNNSNEKILNDENNLNLAKSSKDKKLTKLDILRKLSPGTELREGLNDIMSGELGAIIVVANPKTFNIFEGGFKVNCKFTSKRLAELAKMDGAIILSEDFKKILYCNALLVPDRNIPSI
jgi:hypothetical protein